MNYKQKFKDYIFKKDYENAFKLFKEITEKEDNLLAEEIVFYQRIFIYSDNKEFEEFSNRIMNYMLEKYPQFEVKKKQIDYLNLEYAPLIKRKNELEHLLESYENKCVIKSMMKCFENCEQAFNELLKTNPECYTQVASARERNFSTISFLVAKYYDNEFPFNNQESIEKDLSMDLSANYFDVIQRLQNLDILYDSFIKNGYTIIGYNEKDKIFQLSEPSVQEKIYTEYRNKLNIIEYYQLKDKLNQKDIIENQITVDDIEKCIEINGDIYEILTKINNPILEKSLQLIKNQTIYDLKKISYTYMIKAEQLDKYVVINGKGQDFTFADIIFFFNCFYAISNIQFISEEHYRQRKQRSSKKPYIKIEKAYLYAYVKFMYEQYECKVYDQDKQAYITKNEIISESGLDSLIDYYTFGSYGVKDICSTPLISIDDDFYIMPSTIMENNCLNNFIKHLKKASINFKEGDVFEDYLKLMLKEHDFKVYDLKKPDLNFITKTGHSGDIDVLAIKGNYIFCFQLKNWSNPLDEQDFKNYDRNLHKAMEQLRYADEYITEKSRELVNFFGNSALDNKKIIKIFISSSVYCSGYQWDDIYISDMNAMKLLFDFGKIKVKNKEVILRQGDKVSGLELVEFLSHPL